MKKAFLIVTLLLSFISSRGFAQDYLSMNDSSLFSVNSDTLPQGSSIIYSGLIYNESATLTYNSNIWIAAAVDTMGTLGADTANFNYLPWDNVNGGAVITIAPGDTAGFTDTIGVGSQFKNGINTVVIWPVANMSGFNGYASRDSARLNVFIYDPLNIKNEELVEQLTLYPNPFSDKIWLITRGKISIEEVRIIDALGKIVFVEKKPGKSFIETANLQQGVYFIELSYTDGLKKRIKTIKQ